MSPLSHSDRCPWTSDIIFLARRYAGAVLAVGLCVFVCLYITSSYCIEMDRQIDLVSDTLASLDLFYTVFESNSDMPKNEGTSLCNSSQMLDLEEKEIGLCTSQVLSTGDRRLLIDYHT